MLCVEDYTESIELRYSKAEEQQGSTPGRSKRRLERLKINDMSCESVFEGGFDFIRETVEGYLSNRGAFMTRHIDDYGLTLTHFGHSTDCLSIRVNCVFKGTVIPAF